MCRRPDRQSVASRRCADATGGLHRGAAPERQSPLRFQRRRAGWIMVQASGFQVDPDSANPDPAGENHSFTLRQAPGFLRDIDVMADFDLWAVTAENVEVVP